jgi:glycosyltransferase involved in cell wall biosynthesis
VEGAARRVSSPDVLLDARRTRRMSVGMTAYVDRLVEALPRVAPGLRFDTVSAGGNFGIAEQVTLPLRALRDGARIVHHMSPYVPLVTPRPFAITIHDLIHLRFPHYFKRSVGPYYAFVVRGACARAARVFTDDPRTAGDLERFLGVDPRKIRVIPLGVDDVYLRSAAPAAAPRPYFLYAGNHREHKDLPTLIAAWRALPPAYEADLYLTGADDVPALEHGARANGTLTFLGDIGAERLASLYAGAAAYVHPALNEGFGLPMLEAAVAGTRVLASSESLPAVLAGVAQTFAPRDVDALAALLRDALDRPPDAAERAQRSTVARAYTWDRCAAATAEVYAEMLAELPTR